MSTSSLLDTFDLEQIESFLSNFYPDESISFGSLVVEMMSGNLDVDLSLFLKTLIHSMLYGIADSKKMLASLLILGFISVILHNMAGMFKNKQTMKVAEYFVAMMAAIVLIQGFDVAWCICLETLQSVMDFMRLFLPVYCLSLGLVKGTITAYGYYQFVFIILYLLQKLLFVIFLPLTRCYLILAFMNGLMGDKRFAGIQGLLEKGIGRGLKSMTYLVVGTGMFRSLLGVRIDHFNKTMVQKAVGAIPVVGDVTDSATQMILGCGSLIQGALGTAALVIMIFICLTPLVKLLFLFGSLQVSGALIGLLGEKNMTKTVMEVSKGYFFLFQIAFFTLLMFLLVVGVMLCQL